jgi:hypothetical protein
MMLPDGKKGTRPWRPRAEPASCGRRNHTPDRLAVKNIKMKKISYLKL